VSLVSLEHYRIEAAVTGLFIVKMEIDPFSSVSIYFITTLFKIDVSSLTTQHVSKTLKKFNQPNSNT
jgi:hypothetical protein